MTTFIDRLLEPPSYGYTRDGALYVPSKRELLREFARRVDPFATRKNWLSFLCWAVTLVLCVPLVIFLRYYFSWPLVVAGFFYSMVFLGSYGTFWFHRYATHHGFQFRNALLRNLARNVAIKIIPEELYVLSHHVHHVRSEQPGDPYNVHGGWLYCFLADANHQLLNRDLSEHDYGLAARLVRGTGVHANDYARYRRWGSICHPLPTLVHYLLNWAFWYGAFFLIGGHALATAMFGAAGVWAFGIRTFNYAGHGGGKDLRRAGIDFNDKDLSVNQVWPGYVAGEWHSNHHLYPSSARSGFLRYQLDLPWLAIRLGAALGIVKSYRDDRPKFLEEHYLPYLRSLGRLSGPEVPAA